MIRKKIPRLDSERKCIFLITFTTEHQFKFILSVSMRDIAEKIFSSPDDLIRTRIKCESRLFSEVVIAVITNFAVFFFQLSPLVNIYSRIRVLSSME